MKKIINGKVYDTETAKNCGEWESSPYRNDFSWFCETLFQKKTGEFFIYGQGNAASPFAQVLSQNVRCSGEKITPIAYVEAQEWAEEHLDGDGYITLFGEPEEDSSKSAIHLHLSNTLIDKLKKSAAMKDISISELVEQIVTANL